MTDFFSIISLVAFFPCYTENFLFFYLYIFLKRKGMDDSVSN